VIPSDIWVRHLGDVPPNLLFPRKVGNPRQFLVLDKEKYMKGVSQLWDKTNLYVSLFSEPQKDLSLYHTLFIDYDSHDGNHAMADLEDEVWELYYWFKRKWHGVPRWIESGRGIHLYFDFPLTLFPDYRNSVKNFYVILQQRFGHSFFDRHTYNENKISRLPFTINQKSDTLAVWINPDECSPSTSFGIFLKSLGEKDIVINQHSGEPIDPSSDLDLLMDIAPFVCDGRRILLWQMIIPRMRMRKWSLRKTLNWCLLWLERTGVDPSLYHNYIVAQYNVPTIPYKWSTFFYYNEDMLYLKPYIKNFTKKQK